MFNNRPIQFSIGNKNFQYLLNDEVDIHIAFMSSDYFQKFAKEFCKIDEAFEENKRIENLHKLYPTLKIAYDEYRVLLKLYDE